MTSTSYYVYDLQGRLLGEYDANGKAVEELVYAEDRLVASARGNDLHPVFTDQVGAPRMVANASGKPLWRWGGEPFGASAPEPDADGDGTPFTFSSRFPGQVADPETGLSYNYFRDYAPALGRYIEPDPIGLAGGPNLYLYVGGSPLGNSDPLGLAPDIDLMPRSGDPAAIYRDRVPNDPNVITVFAHGAPDRVVDQRRGGVVNVDDKALADMIRKTDKWKRGVRNVRFIACDTGKTVDGKPSIAQQVASLLRDGARVEAPDSYVRTDSTGRQIVGYGDYYNQVGGVFLPGTYRTFWKSF